MTNERRIEIALLIIRITAAIFLGLWATLKFLRPEWFRNIVNHSYHFPIQQLTDSQIYFVGFLQIITVLAFVSGFMRTWTYGLMVLMSAAGVLGSLGSFMVYYNYPKNLMLTSIPTLGALIALFLLRDMDNLFSWSGRKKK